MTNEVNNPHSLVGVSGRYVEKGEPKWKCTECGATSMTQTKPEGPCKGDDDDES